MFEKRIGFLMDGECVVERQKNDGGSIPLNVLKKYDCFGIISIFSKNKKFPTLIKAIKNTRIMFIESESFKDAVKENSSIAFALMAFMSERIEFLNSKIATFSADSVEDKFAIFLLSESKRLNSSEFALNLSKTAKILNSGRASVYRAIDSLEKSSLIKFENKKIILLDPKGLERNLK